VINCRLPVAAAGASATGRGLALSRFPRAGCLLLRSGRLGSLLVAGLALLPGTAGAGSLGDVFERVAPSVVVVRTTDRDIPETGERRSVSVSGLGSGVLISADGKVLTAAHVVQTASEIRVDLVGGARVAARVIASEPDADVAVLQLERVPPGAVVARLGDSDQARIGDEVFIVGAPYGISHTLTVGHIGGRQKPGQVWDRFTLAEFLQTDAAINQGNSGGPMFNMAGEVIGVVSHIISKSGGFEGLGFVVTSNVARQLVLDRRSPWWGFDGVILTEDLARVFNLAGPGLLVQRVVENSPAARLGLRGGFMKARVGDRTLTVGGDVVLSVQGMRCNETHRVQDALAVLKPGDRVTVTVLREGKVHELAMVVP
jgi:S1-C subfamily serine protease